jgi:hypothetical protein
MPAGSLKKPLIRSGRRSLIRSLGSDFSSPPTGLETMRSYRRTRFRLGCRLFSRLANRMGRLRLSSNPVKPCRQVWLASSLRPRIGVACLASKLACFARNGSIWVELNAYANHRKSFVFRPAGDPRPCIVWGCITGAMVCAPVRSARLGHLRGSRGRGRRGENRTGRLSRGGCG